MASGREANSTGEGRNAVIEMFLQGRRQHLHTHTPPPTPGHTHIAVPTQPPGARTLTVGNTDEGSKAKARERKEKGLDVTKLEEAVVFPEAVG